MTAAADPGGDSRPSIACLITAEGPGAPAGVAALSAELRRLGRHARLIVLDRGSGVTASTPAQPGDQSVEVLAVAPDAGVGETLRRGMGRIGRADLVLRIPAVGVDAAFVGRLLERIDQGTAKPDVIVAARPVRSAGPIDAVVRSLQARLLTLVFAPVATDPDSGVMLFRRKVWEDSAPRADGDFADWEFLARANFVGHLIDELPLGAAWTGGPPRPVRWGRLWAEAYRLLNRPDFPVRLSPAGGAAQAPAAAPKRERRKKRKGK